MPDSSNISIAEARVGRRLGLLFGFIVVFAIVIQGSSFTIDTGSVGLVARMGKLIKQAEPGLHWKMPFGIDEVEIVPVDSILQVGNHAYGDRPPAADHTPSENQSFLTLEKSILNIEFSVTYLIADPVKYVGSVVDTPELIRLTTRSQLQAAVGREGVMSLLTAGTSELASSVAQDVQRELDAYGAGVSIQEVIFKKVVVPPGVGDAIEDVASAIRESDRLILDAQKTATAMTPDSEKRAADIVSEANKRATEILAKSREEIARFNAAYASYQTDPAGVVEQLYQDMLRTALPRAGSVIVTPEDGRQNASIVYFNQR